MRLCGALIQTFYTCMLCHDLVRYDYVLLVVAISMMVTSLGNPELVALLFCFPHAHVYFACLYVVCLYFGMLWSMFGGLLNYSLFKQ